MANEVKMEYQPVGTMSKEFNEIAGILRQVNRTLGECVETLNETAYTGRVGGTAVKKFIEDLQPVIVDLSEKSHEVSDDLAQSIQAFMRGDEEGATRFY